MKFNIILYNFAEISANICASASHLDVLCVTIAYSVHILVQSALS